MNKITIFLIQLMMTLLAITAQASNGGRGGGDLCEDQIKLIKTDLEIWINSKGPEGLTLSGISTADYSKAMLSSLASTKIRCVSKGDAFYPVEIDGTPKVCRFDFDEFESWITCDADKFMASTNADQYVLIHHEYAGLAKLEIPDGDQSQYAISNQISSFLTSTIVKKLFVKSKYSGPATAKDIMNLQYVPEFGYFEALQYCDAFGGHIPSAREFAEMATSAGAEGIRETQFANVERTDARVVAEEQKNLQDKYYTVEVGKNVAFYFNGNGFKAQDFNSQIPNANGHRYWTQFFPMIFFESRMPWGESAGFMLDQRATQREVICLPGKDPNVRPIPKVLE